MRKISWQFNIIDTLAIVEPLDPGDYIFKQVSSHSLNSTYGTGNWTEPTLFRMREAKKVAAPSESQRASHQRGVTKLPNQKWESSWATTLLLRTRRSSPSQLGLYSTADGLNTWGRVNPVGNDDKLGLQTYKTSHHHHHVRTLPSLKSPQPLKLRVLGYFVG